MMLARVEEQPKASGKLRKVLPVNVRGIIPAIVEGSLPKLTWVDPRSLFIEADYQRDILENSITMIRKIVVGWKWAHIKAAVCVRDAQDRLVIVDGQHTAIAAVTHGGIEKIPVMIVEARTIKQRAAAFVSQNKDRLAITAAQMHYAGVAAGNEIAVAASEACEKAKVTILRTSRGAAGKYRIGETFSVGIIHRIVAKVGVHHAARVLKVLVDAKRAPISAHEIKAVYQLLYDEKYKGKFEPFDLATLIRSKAMEEWRARAWQLVPTGVVQGEATAAVWFKTLSKAK